MSAMTIILIVAVAVVVVYALFRAYRQITMMFREVFKEHNEK